MALALLHTAPRPARRRVLAQDGAVLPAMDGDVAPSVDGGAPEIDNVVGTHVCGGAWFEDLEAWGERRLEREGDVGAALERYLSARGADIPLLRRHCMWRTCERTG